MPKKSASSPKYKNASQPPLGNAGELHQTSSHKGILLTTNSGLVISDNQNSLKATPRGPTLLEDFVLREKITHFDHERIPERIVHARGTAAHGYFELTKSLKSFTSAKILTETGVKTPVFTRFSTVAGGAGSVDTPRDVRGFAVKFYTKEGNWDLVGNNIPVFFIQDAMKFPDLVHAVKMEPDRGFPQAASAHDTFWDFISLMPESMHMIMWAMSDRTLPRSLRMMEGFGVHSFRLLNEMGASTFVKFHWLPKLGLQSHLWDEAVKIAGADPDYHRRDLWEAIQSGNYPEWNLAVQIFSEADAETFPFDHLDPTKLIPEELVPLTVIGRMVLDRMPDNFFAETEQVAFCPTNIVPGIDFSNDPLLQGRLFSYLDTQLSRIGTPNFHQLPINAPKCPFHNHQRDGKMQMQLPMGRVNYEPNSLAPDGPRASVEGYRSVAEKLDDGKKGRIRAESFADDFSQAHLFYASQSEIEQAHLASALVFELSKVDTPAIRERMVGLLRSIDESLAQRVSDGLGLPTIPPKTAPGILHAYQPSPSLALVEKMKPTLKGRCVGILIDDGTDASQLAKIKEAIQSIGGAIKVIAPKITGAKLEDGTLHSVDGHLAGSPSVLFDAVCILLSKTSAERLSQESAAIDFVRDAYGHLKALGLDAGGRVLFSSTGLTVDSGVISAEQHAAFIKAATTRQWKREPRIRTLA
jgi:catalase